MAQARHLFIRLKHAEWLQIIDEKETVILSLYYMTIGFGFQSSCLTVMLNVKQA